MVDSLGCVYKDITCFEALHNGYVEARKGKRYKGETLKFSVDLESNLLKLRDELRDEGYTPSGFKQFKVFDPKERKIYAPYFRDRVVHRSLYLKLEPFFDKKFVKDSYACRKEKGTHKAVKNAQKMMRKTDNDYYMVCDVENYFGSVDHEILVEIFSRYIKCQKTVRLVQKLWKTTTEELNTVRVCLLERFTASCSPICT